MDFQTAQRHLRGMGVTSTMINRGYELYKGNAIQSMDFTINLEDETIGIVGQVRGSKYYAESIMLKVYGENLEIVSKRCSCPYPGWDTCKHNGALLVRFFMEYYEGIKTQLVENNEKKLKEFNYENFKNFINKLDYSTEKVKIAYKIKGLDKMVNFKIYFEISGIAEEEKEEFLKNMFYEFYDFNVYFDYLTEEDYSLIKNLRTFKPRVTTKDFSIFLPKDKNSTLIIKELIKKGKLFGEKGEKLSYGGLIKPEILLDGNEEILEITTIKKPDNLYVYNGVAWVFEDGVFYDYDNSVNEIDNRIFIPQKDRGEFLFYQLKRIKKEFNAQMGEYYSGLKLMNIEPQIKFILDYKNDAICFDNFMTLSGVSYKNLEIGSPEVMEKHNKIQKLNETTWERVNLSDIFEMFKIINRFKCFQSGGRFVISDKNEIQRFLTMGLPHFPEDWEIEKTLDFESLKVEELELQPIVEFSENGDRIDWFEFTVKYSIDGNFYSKKELEKLIEYNENGEAFIKIGNKYFLIKESEAENKVKNMTKNAEIDKKGNYRSSYFNMIYYRNLIKNSGINFTGNKAFDDLDRDISNMSILEDMEVPQEVEQILRPYQKEGHKWLNFLNKYRFGGILADDMGLGKTLQTLSFLRALDKTHPSLIVVPKSLVYNWKNETEKFFPDLKLMIYDGSLAQRKNKLQEMKEFDLVVTSFDIASRDHEELKAIKFLYLVLDEAHNIKNRTTKRTANIKKIHSQYRLALTGTPLENSLEELWSIFDFVIPGYLGSFKNFNESYVKVEDNKERAYFELKNKISPFMLRRKKEDVLKELPDKIENIVRVEMNEEQNIAYNLILDKVKSDLETMVSSKGFNNSQIGILAALTKLRQICNHPNLVFEDNEKVYESAKLETLIELIKESIYSGHKILVFSQFVRMLKLIKEKLAEEEITFDYLDGSTKNRIEIVNSFNESEETKVFLLSLKAGGTGLNLTSADIVIHVDPWWNPQIERQATDRAHRMGQEKKVMVYKLITKGTVEEKMLKLQERKKEIFDNIIESNSGSLNKVTWNDIQELLSIE